MTPDELAHVIEKGESLTVEFKRATNGAINDDTLVEAVTCMANGEGGSSSSGSRTTARSPGWRLAMARRLIHIFSRR